MQRLEILFRKISPNAIGIPWFPYIPAFGSDDVNGCPPTDAPEPCSGENDVAIAQYDCDWQILRNATPVFWEEIAWHRSSGNVSSFIVTLNRDTRFLSELKTSDPLATRSQFRVN
jgi:hypothetical protein